MDLVGSPNLEKWILKCQTLYRDPLRRGQSQGQYKQAIISIAEYTDETNAKTLFYRV